MVTKYDESIFNKFELLIIFKETLPLYLQTYKKGDYFGESSFLENKSMQYSLIAKVNIFLLINNIFRMIAR